MESNIPYETKRTISNISKVLRLPNVPNSTPLLSAIYQEIANKFPKTPIPVFSDPSLIQPLNKQDYINIPQQVRKEIETRFGVPPVTKKTASKIAVRPKYFYRIQLPRSGRQINIGIWSKCTKSESAIISYKMIQWLYYLDETLPLRTACSNTLTVYLFMTDHVKKMPEASDRTKKFTPVNVNSAFTYGCAKDNQIIIFRKEEWFKVFIHESMHALGVDFSSAESAEMSRITNTVIQDCFRGVESRDLRIYESYTEMWAEIANILISVFDATKRPTYDAIVKKRVETMIHMEMIWSLIQANRVLAFYRIPGYRTLLNGHKGAKVYKETCGDGGLDGGAEGADTCVFSYYILKSILYYHWIAFFQWCGCNRAATGLGIKCILFDSNRIADYAQFISKYAKGRLYQYALEQVAVFLTDNASPTSNKTTLTMSIWGKYRW